MKHLKTYENVIKKIYKKGDIVLLNDYSDSEFELPYAKILRRDKGKAKDRFIDRYYVEILFPNTKHWLYFPNQKEHETFILEFRIIRKLTKEEKENLKLKINANKYNI